MYSIFWVWQLVDEAFEGCKTSSNWQCQECGGPLIISQGQIVCRSCGLVVSCEYVSPTYQMGEECLNEGRDVSAYGSLGNRLHIVDGLGSYIGFHKDNYFRDAHGQTLTGKDQKKFKHLRSIYSTRVRIGHEEARFRALRTLNHVSKLLMLTDQVRDRTAYLYKKHLSDSAKPVGNNILLMAVCLLTAVREFRESAPVTLEEIADVFEKCGHRVNVRTIVREASRLKMLTGCAPSIRKAEDYVPRVISMLMNDDKVLNKIKSRGWDTKEYEHVMRTTINQILQMLPSSKRGGRNPFIFAVSAAYASDRLIAQKTGRRTVLTQQLVSRATAVAEYSIRDHFGVIKNLLRQSTFSVECVSP